MCGIIEFFWLIEKENTLYINIMNKINTRKALNPAYRKHKPLRKNVNAFIHELVNCLKTIKISDQKGESEEHIKDPIKVFLQNTFYKEYYINTKDRIDLAIYTGKDANSDVSVIIEAKRPSNKSEFLSKDNLNKKALQELLLYYLRERIDNDNNNIKHLIATDGYRWFMFKSEDFYKYFYKNKALLKEYETFRAGNKDSKKNELFYNEIASKYISVVEQDLPFVLLDFTKKRIDTYSDADLNTLYKIFSDVHLLGANFGNDSNQLNKAFYNELLHIIGLEEIKEGGKKIINRKAEKDRDYASLLESAIFTLEDKDHLDKIKSIPRGENKAFEAGLELSLTWINRILFLKLLESQLLAYHAGAKEYRFLNSEFIKGFDDLNDLFFSALAKKQTERHPKFKDRFQYIPYLNSSLFEKNDLENEAFDITALNDDEITIFGQTVLKDSQGKRIQGKIKTLDYLFQFLEAYDFATDGKEGIEDAQENKTLINASVLGLIFEKINGYREGSFYTPAYITMYMSRETLRRAVLQKFKEQENDQIETFEDLQAYTRRYFKKDDLQRFNKIIDSLKIVDPAVGSGHFLVSALNELISIKNDLGILIDPNGLPLQCEILIENDELYITDKLGHLLNYVPQDKEAANIQKTLFHEKQTLIENCLFGVDINPNSVKICRLRLWIELLKNAYYAPDGELQTLPNIDINIKTGNSLISRFDLDMDIQKALRGTKWTIFSYQNAVQAYKNTSDKKEKQKLSNLIEDVKTNFKTELRTKDPIYVKLTKLKNKFHDLFSGNMLFEPIAPYGKSDPEKERKQMEKEMEKEIKMLETQVEEIKNSHIYRNAFEWRFEFPEVLDKNGKFLGFDVVIGNPPYMRVQEIQKTQPQAKLFYEQNYFIAKSAYDLANLFFERAITISTKHANNAFIFPHKFFNSSSTEQFRDYLYEGKYIDKLTHFGANMIFDEADTYTCIANFSKKANKGFYVYKANFKEDFQLKMLDNSNYGLITYEQLNKLSELYGSNQWILLDGQKSVNLFEKLYSSKITVKDRFEGIYQGLATSKDELYIGELFSENENTYTLKFDKLGKKIEVEKTFFKPFLKGKDIQRYTNLEKKLFVFFPYILNNHDAEIISLKDLKESYPLTYSYVIRNEKAFKARESGKAKKLEHWYAYIYPKNLNKFEQTKLTCMDICSKHSNITINYDFYHSTTGYSLVKKKDTKESYEYLLSILNSRLIWWFMINTGDTLQGDARRFKTNYLNPFPLPKEITKEAEQPFIGKVNEILALKKANPEADTIALEHEIDVMVYALYGLSEEEIKIVEGA